MQAALTPILIKPLLTGNRFFLLEGDLRKSPVSGGKARKKRRKLRRFFLFTDMLMYTEHNTKKNLFQYKGSFFLHPDEYTVLPSDSGFQPFLLLIAEFVNSCSNLTNFKQI